MPQRIFYSIRDHRRKNTQRLEILHFALGVVLTMCIGSYGCAMMQLPDYPKTSPSTFNNAKTEGNLCVATRALTNTDDLKQYFGADLYKDKILPVYITVENKSKSSSFLVSSDSISVQHNKSSDNMAKGHGSVSGVSSTGNVLQVFGGLSGAFGVKLTSDATVVKENLASKALYSHTVSPGKSVDGFVYFTMPNDRTPLADLTLAVQVKELGSDVMHQFIFTLE